MGAPNLLESRRFRTWFHSSTRQADGLYALIHDLDQDGDLTMDELIRCVYTQRVVFFWVENC